MGLADRPLALTLGDPAGIGPDITLLAWQARKREAIPPFVLLGDADVLAARARALGLDVPIGELGDASEAPAVFRDALPVLPVNVAGKVSCRPSRPSRRACGRESRSSTPWPCTARRRARHCHQSDLQGGALWRGLFLSGAYGISRRPRLGDGKEAASGDAARKPPAESRAGHHPRSAQGRAAAS